MDLDITAAAADNDANKQMELNGTAPATSKADGEGDEQACSSNAQLTPTEVDAIIEKQEDVIKELIVTEQMYVADLQIIVEGYIRHFLECPNDPPQPEALKDRLFMIFGNIEAIYEWHRNKFLHHLQLCIYKPELLGLLFRRLLELKMCLYETYCRNKPVSENIVSEHDSYFQEIGNRLGQKKVSLADLLMKPIQRVKKYPLLIKEILTYSEQAQCPAHVLASLHDAMTCTDIISKNAISMMDVGNLHGFTGNITAQGKLILQDTVNITDLIEQSEEREMRLFLFEQCLIFTDPVGKKGTSATFNYVSHIEVNGMELKEVPDTYAFLLKSVERNQRNRLSYFCRPKTEENHQKWLAAIKDIIETRLSTNPRDDPEYSDSDDETEFKKKEEEEFEMSYAYYFDFLWTHVFYSLEHNVPEDLKKRARREFNMNDKYGYWKE